jgi:zinc protease
MRSKRLLLLFVSLFLPVAAAASNGVSGAVSTTGTKTAGGAPDGYISETLANGLTVSILPDPLNTIVATQVWYHVGSANEEAKTRGFAHLFEHMMFGGTAAHPKRDFDDFHHVNGGENNAFTSFDETVYVSEMPPANAGKILEFEADRMVNLDLNQENLDNEKKIVTEELRVSTENDPVSRLGTALLRKALDDHPYAIDPAGTKEDIAAVTLDHAREFYAKYYRPKNAHLVVVGPVDGPKTLEAVRRLFGSLPADGTTPPDVPAVHGWKFPKEIDLQDDIPPVEVGILGFPLPPPASSDYFALLVMQELLSGGNVDPFEEELVKRRHKALGGGTQMFHARRGGAIAFYSYNLPYRRRATAFRLMAETRAVLGRFDWLDDGSLAAAKRKLVRADLSRIYYADSRASEIGSSKWWLGDERLAFESASRIEAVTAGDVRSAFRKYVLDPEPIRIYVRPEHVPVLVRMFGWVYPMVN